MHPRNQGVTLLEVMVVVAIIGVFATLSVTSFQGMLERQRVSGAQRELVLMMQEARQKARATRQPVRLNLRVADENDRQVTRMRWESLACSDTWGTVCPIEACLDNRCGEGGCECPETGPELIIPPQLDVTQLVGLCWVDATGTQSPIVAPRSADGRPCEPSEDAPDPERLVLRRNHGTPELPNWRPELVFQADKLTASIRSVDCDKHGSTPGCQ
ncbi:Type IV fimbrial biogenesis protein FimT [Myxococcus hansupus]|uniref:Type IV fimbrial biogenesis protein FimT n=1 Tax=Pseudomyxococcus hansupus TaxID=1297742 RepID=A0A0H4X1M3_9BACT|nr:prepilin-type N-terminal cleavage/methylation domain-containing protein [Myxococcus hansupus]AKQ69039.1 Type IV fimbrial biogenesis protein FimT [Myxococcus hansupus]